MIRLIIFDFDGTLSSEREYIYGCLKTVSKILEKKYGIEESYEKLIRLFNESWHDTFGRLFRQENIKYNAEQIGELVKIYRDTPPVVRIYEDVIQTFLELKARNIKLGVLTNGYYRIQKDKIKKSQLEEYLDIIEIPDLYGREFWKPDARRITNILEQLIIGKEEVLYIGDSDSDYIFTEKAGISMAYIERSDAVNEFHFRERVQYVIKSLQDIERII